MKVDNERKTSRWEYQTRIMDRQADLAQLGAEGWELVSVLDAGGDQAVFYFKRRI